MEPIWSSGAWIKRRRHMLDLTQEVLAARVGCSVELISKIEGDARRHEQLVTPVNRRANEPRTTALLAPSAERK